MKRLSFPLLLMCGLVGCASNPVTGERELHLVSEGQEVQIGQQQYAPARQSQGGTYVTGAGVDAYVQSVGNRLAAVADRKLPYEFTVLNNSDLNAWALPGGKIAINRGLLLELKSEAELAAVLSHEIVHAAARHGAQQMEKGQLLQLGSVVAQVAAAAYGGAGLGDLVGTGAAVGSQFIQAKFGRDDELEADQYGMKYMKAAGYDLQAAVSLQELFVRKAQGGDQDWLSGLLATHPPSQERVETNRQTMKRLGGPGGDTGEDRYERGIAELRKDAPAYARYDEAAKAAAKKEYSRARSLVSEAIRLEPRESRFHSLLGDLEMINDNSRAALTHFEKARSLDPGYFKPYAQAGIANFKLGNKGAAEPLLRQSMEMLPTVPGAYYLARIYEDRGNTGEAVKLYQMVAGTQTQLGQDARERLARLGGVQTPGAQGTQGADAYLAVQPRIDNRGNVWLQVGNRSRVPVSDVSILVAVVDPRTGQTAAGPVRVGTGRDSIPPQQAVNLQTSLGPFNSANVVNYVRWKVESVRPGNP